jgi:hypothetical protein
MIGILDTMRGFVPLHMVSSVTTRTNEHGVDMADVRLIDGSTREQLGGSWNDFMRSAVQITPAEPGTNLIHMNSGGEADIFFTPVIAWALCVDGEMRPVTPSGVGDSCGEPPNGWHTLMPDGRVVAASSWNDGLSDEQTSIVRRAFEALQRSLGNRPGPLA